MRRIFAGISEGTSTFYYPWRVAPGSRFEEQILSIYMYISHSLHLWLCLSFLSLVAWNEYSAKEPRAFLPLSLSLSLVTSDHQYYLLVHAVLFSLCSAQDIFFSFLPWVTQDEQRSSSDAVPTRRFLTKWSKYRSSLACRRPYDRVQA